MLNSRKHRRYSKEISTKTNFPEVPVLRNNFEPFYSCGEYIRLASVSGKINKKNFVYGSVPHSCI